MDRVLHVFDQPGPTGQTLALRLSADLANENQQATGSRHAWLLAGGEPLRDAAVTAGIDPSAIRLVAGTRRLRVPGSTRSLKPLLDQADRVECWTPGAAAMVSGLGRLDAVSRFGQATLSPMISELIKQSFAKSLSRDAARSSMRERVRARLDVPEQAVTIALLADKPELVDMRPLILSMAFTYEILDACGSPYRDVRLIVHPHTLGRMQTLQLAELREFPHMLIQDAGLLTPWDTLAGFDLALASTPLHAGLSIAWAQAFGMPIVAPPEPRLPGLEKVSGLLPAVSDAPKHLAKAMTDWAQSLPEPAWTVLS